MDFRNRYKATSIYFEINYRLVLQTIFHVIICKAVARLITYKYKR